MSTVTELVGGLLLSAEALAVLSNPRQAAAILGAIGTQIGDERFARAAGHLNGKERSGRPAIDDSDALRQMQDLVASDETLAVDAAARFVARTLSGNHSTEASAARLARKYRRQFS
jgi:hypothetical protein